ncbi:MAG: DUF975 family protein [Erysipelotrichaceae bacterium]|nr:DUF975 family protein [Erysipelotrichaceae bacterium]
MNNAKIRFDTATVLKEAFQPLFLTFLFILLINQGISTFASMFGQTLSQILTLLATVATLPLAQGQVKAALKAVNNQIDAIDPKDDGLAGFSHYRRYFSTYFVVFMITLMSVLMIVLVGVVLVLATQGDVLSGLGDYYLTFTDVNALVLAMQSDAALMSAIYSTLGIVLAILGVIGLVYLFIYSHIALAPFILEKYDYRGLKAVTTSAKYMKGRKWDLVKLMVSFLPHALLGVVAMSVIDSFVSNMVLASLLSSIVFIAVLNVRFKVALAYFFEEADIAYEGQTHD